MVVNKMNDSQETPCNNEVILRKGRRKLKILFYWHTIGIFFSITAIAAIQTIQTSINIEDDIGAISLTAAYISSSFFGLFCVTPILRVFGTHVALVIGDTAFLIYCLTNFYPTKVVLTIGGAISGIARSLYLPTYTIIVMEIAAQCTEYAAAKSGGYYFNYFQSRFYGFVESSSIFGNLLSYAILSGTKSDDADPVDENSTPNTTSFPNSTITISAFDPYQYCGVHDCQDPEIVGESLDQYVPPDQKSVYIFLTVSSSLSFLSVVMHTFLYPGLGSFGHKLNKVRENVSDGLSENISKSSSKFSIDNISIKSSGHNSGYYENPGYVNNEEKLDETCTEKNDNHSIQISEISIESEQETKGEGNYCSILKTTFAFLISPRSLLLSPSAFHFGMFLGFAFADLTRAYASCVAGVEMTGLFATTLGAAGMISALLYGKLNFPHRRYILYAGLSILTLALYIACYTWDPDPDTIWMLYIMFIVAGIVKGAIRQNIVETYTVHFLHNKDVALSVYNVWFLAGVGIQYALSTFMCVETKLYTQLGIFTTALILFIVVELIYMRGNDSDKKKQENGEIKTKL